MQATTAQQQHQHKSNSNSRNADFSGTIERILSMAEPRMAEGHHPLTRQDIDALHMLCSVQASKSTAGTVVDDLGFADVEVDVTVQLMEYLEKHVALASGLDIVQDSFDLTQKIKRKESAISMDKWLQGVGRERIGLLRLGLEAAAILLFIMNSPAIDRRVINEDSIEASIVLFRHNLSKNILPSLNQVGHLTAASHNSSESQPGGGTTPASSKKRRRSSAGGGGQVAVIRDMKKVYRYILGTVGVTVVVMERIDTLVQRVPLDDQQLLTISSGALTALELDPANEASIKVTHQLHIAMNGVVTSIFRKYPRHRQIIVEDLFPIMLRMPTHKKSMRTFPIQCSSVLYPSGLLKLSQSLVQSSQDGHFIQSISALILALVQSSVVRPSFQDDHNNHNNNTMIMQGDGSNIPPQQQPPKLVSGLRECQVISDLFVKMLLQRCAKKGEDGGASEFRPILSNLIDDLLLLLLVPEFPAAEMILLAIANWISQDLMRAMSPKAITQNDVVETTYLNTIFDALGRICASEACILKYDRENSFRITTVSYSGLEKHVDCYCHNKGSDKLMLNCDHCQTWYHGDCVGLSKEMVPEEWFCDTCQLGRIVEFERDRNTNLGEEGCPPDLIDAPYCMRRLLIDYLSIVSRKSNLSGVRDAYEFQLARWLSELNFWGKSGGTDRGTSNMAMSFLSMRLLELWDPRESSSLVSSASKSLSGMLHCLSDEGRSRMVVHLATKQSNLLLSFKGQIGLFVKLMSNDTSALLRKLALKAIEKISEGDGQLMIYPFIKKAVTARFSDEAISVREAAVSLVGSYAVRVRDVANAFHGAFMTGLNDTGVSVRKRTVKILQDILSSNPEYTGRAEACSEMLRLAADPKEDDGVRDSIYDLFVKIWLENGDENVATTYVSSPVSPSVDEKLMSPGDKVEGLEMRTPAGLVTPTPQARLTPTPPKQTRSTDRFIRRHRMRIRSEIAAEQMVEVVKAADTGENLTALFRELLSGLFDGDKDRKASERQKRKVLVQSQCKMIVDALFEKLLSVEENREKYKKGVGKEIVAIMRTIKVFTEVSPEDVLVHLDTLLPYMQADNGLAFQEESIVVGSVCDVLSLLTPSLGKEDIERLGGTTLAKDLVKITYQFGKEALASAVRALCALAHHKNIDDGSIFRSELLSLAQTFYDYLLKHRDKDDFATKTNKAKANIQRALSVLGNICRYHESSADELESNSNDEPGEDSTATQSLSLVNLTLHCETTFLVFLEKNDPRIKCSALRGLCGVFIAHPREMLKMDQSGLITSVMSPTADPSLQLEALGCWREILLTEEARIESGEAKAKMESKKNITLSKKISGDQDADATLFGGVLSSHAKRLFQMTQVRDKRLRYAALDLLGHLLRQGQVNPNEAVPFLLALQGDVEEEGIRSLALKLLMTEGEKRPDMLRQRVRAGVKQAYWFQKAAYPDKEEISALVQVRRNGSLVTECVFGRVFKECLASIKKQRQGLFRNLLGLFDLQNRPIAEGKIKKEASNGEKVVADLPLLCFTSQVLAYLPYSVASDPLYIVHYITSTIALQGPDLLDRLATFLRPYGLSSNDAMDENNTEEDELEVAAKRNVPRHAKQATVLMEADFDSKTFSKLCEEAAAMTLLLRLKMFLRQAYNLSESRVLSFNPDAKERVGEKAISRVGVLVFDSKVPMQTCDSEAGTNEFDGMILQYTEFRKLMRHEAAVAERSDESDNEENDKSRPAKRKRGDSDEMVEED